MDNQIAAKAHLAACLALVRPVSMTDDAALEWINVAAKELRGFPPSTVEQACSEARRKCSHHAKILPFVVEECERLETEFAKAARNARLQALPRTPYIHREPEPVKLRPEEIADNERWLNTVGDEQAKLRRIGLGNGALVMEGDRVRYAPDLR